VVRDDSVLFRDPELRLAQVPDGRILVKHRRGTTLRAAVPLDDLKTVLDLVDGKRTVAEIVTELADRYEEADVRRLLENLRGDVLHTEPPEPVSTIEIPRVTKRAVVGSIAILGGGTAGYLSALALRRWFPDLAVTLIASSRIGIIGVGEATTPLMPQFLHVDLGIDPHALFREVRPTFKLGIRFLWGEGEGFFYPFGPNPLLDLERVNIGSFAAQLMAENKVPVSIWDIGPPHLGFGTDVAYHLDNRRFVAFLAKQAEAAGVVHRDLHIVDVAREGDRITALICEDGREHAFDFFVDCSGFAARLIGNALGSPFQPFDHCLFTDRAWAAAVPETELRPYTLAETMDAGWCWNVPQHGEAHIGYVYCSEFIDDSRALDEMRTRYPTMGEPRLIRFRSGRRRDFWRGNVVAMGNAYGFVEPLESTALHMLIRQIGLLGKILAHDPSEAARTRVNHRLADWWDYLAWFLAIHYAFNQRRDTPFWQHCREKTDLSAHVDLIDRFRDHGPLQHQDLASRLETRDPLWGPEGVDLILAGQGVGCPMQRPPDHRAQPDVWRALASRCVTDAFVDPGSGGIDAFVRPFIGRGAAFS